MNELKIQELHFCIVGDEGHYRARHDRAKARLDAGRSPENCWFFGIAQFSELRQVVDVMGSDAADGLMIRIQPIDEPPDFVEILRATGTDENFPVALTWSKCLSHELVVRPLASSEEGSSSLDIATRIALTIAPLIRIRSKSEFLLPVASNYSWSSISAAPERGCAIEAIEHYPKASSVRENPPDPTLEDIKWAVEHWENSLRLANSSPRFATGVTAFVQHNLQSNDGMTAAMLWTGIEALLNPVGHDELTYRISQNGASLLEPRGKARIVRARKIKKLYNTRSDVVHGAEIKDRDEKLSAHNIEAHDLLADLIVAILDRGNIPSTDDFERLILSDEENQDGESEEVANADQEREGARS